MKKMLVLTLVLVAASTANAQLNLFYDVRPSLAAIDTPVAPFVHSASLAIYVSYGIGQDYPLAGTPLGGRGDGQAIWVCPKMHDTTDYIGTGAPDGVDEHISTFNPTYDWSVGTFYLYGEFNGAPTEVVSSIGVDQNIPAAAFASGGSFYLTSAVTTIENAGLWDGNSITGGNATTSLKMVQVPVIAGTPNPTYDATAGLHGSAKLAKVALAAEYKDLSDGTVGLYNLFLSQNSLLITKVANPGPAGSLPYNFGYAAGALESGLSNTTPDMVINVVRKGDYDYDGGAATSVDDTAYYSIGADPALVNPVELWLGDFDNDGAPNTSLDDYDYYKHANIP